jgi:hypothetical protein
MTAPQQSMPNVPLVSQPVFLVDVNGNPISSTNPSQSNLTQIGSVATQMGGSDGVTASHVLEVVNGTYNGATVDQLRGNIDNYVLLASGVITSNGTSLDQINYNARGIKIFITTGSFGATESTMTVTLQGKDPVTNTYYTIITSASLSASAFSVLSVYPGITTSSNVAVSDVLPRTFRVSYAATAWGTGGSTLGISCAMIV